ncbi:MAG: hypothetical protein RJA36_1458 [Pseudomonadota bacterium]|jgi:hypothetical protein
MAQFRTGRVTPSASNAFRQIDDALRLASRRFAEWRVNVALSPGFLDATETFNAYQALASAVNIVDGLINTAGLGLRYEQEYGKPVGYSPVSDWNDARTVALAFQTWLGNSWLWRTSEGYPAFHRKKANGELEALTKTLTTGERTAVLAQIDAVLAAIE